MVVCCCYETCCVQFVLVISVRPVLNVTVKQLQCVSMKTGLHCRLQELCADSRHSSVPVILSCCKQVTSVFTAFYIYCCNVLNK